MRFLNLSVGFLMATGLMLLIRPTPATAATPEACSLLSPEEVAKIIGNDAPILTQHPTTAMNGVKISTCVYQQKSAGGNTASITVTTLDSTAAAQERLKAYGEAIEKGGGKVEPDTVAGKPAEFVTSKGGTGQMFVVKGNILLGASVGTAQGGKTIPLRDLARVLLTAGLAKI